MPPSVPHAFFGTQTSSAGLRSLSLVIQTIGCSIAESDGVGDVGVAEHVAVEAAGLDAVDAVLRRPVAFLVGDEKGAVVIDAHAVRGAETGGEDVGARAVGAHAQQRAVVRHERGQRVAGGLGVVEIARGIGLQAHRELVEMLGDLMVVVEALDEVDLAVAVEVAQARELVAAGDEEFVAAELHAERLEQSAGDAPPASAVAGAGPSRHPRARHRHSTSRRSRPCRPA